MAKQLVILEEEYEASHNFNSKHALTFQDISLDDLRNELPERQPRYPFITSRRCKPEQQMMYAGSKNQLVSAAELTKVFETRNIDDLSEEWLINKLSFFR
ncbi:unnamed protein product [Coregonus sp. 'balchen']|nr:unnamed protein product [Coregonus sp. 'balchen']